MDSWLIACLTDWWLARAVTDRQLCNRSLDFAYGVAAAVDRYKD